MKKIIAVVITAVLVAPPAFAGHWVSGYSVDEQKAQDIAFANAAKEIKHGKAKCIGFAEGKDPLRYVGVVNGMYQFQVHVSHHRGSCKLPPKWEEDVRNAIGVK